MEVQLEMKLSNDKTYIVQSQDNIVDGLIKAGVLEGNVCKKGEYIRRLGVDHNLEGMVTKEGGVSIGRRRAEVSG